MMECRLGHGGRQAYNHGGLAHVVKAEIVLSWNFLQAQSPVDIMARDMWIRYRLASSFHEQWKVHPIHWALLKAKANEVFCDVLHSARRPTNWRYSGMYETTWQWNHLWRSSKLLWLSRKSCLARYTFEVQLRCDHRWPAWNFLQIFITNARFNSSFIASSFKQRPMNWMYFLLPMKRWSQTGAYPHVFSYYFNWDLAWERFHNVPCHICSSFVFTSGVVQLFVFCVSWLWFWVDGAGIRRGAIFRVTGGIVHDQLRTYVVDLELGSTPFEGAEHVGVLAEMTFHAMTLIQVLNGWDAGEFVMASDTRNLVCN